MQSTFLLEGGMMCLFKPNTYDPKDWQCPKPSCRTVNFKKRMTCISCGARKPDGTNRPLDDWRDGEKNLSSSWDCESCQSHNEAGAIYCMNCKRPSKEMSRLMDEDKQKRSAEEGRAGGLYDRQDPSDRKEWDSEGEEFDDFGRRKKRDSARSRCATSEAATTVVRASVAVERANAEHVERLSAGGGGSGGAGVGVKLASKHQAALERLRSMHVGNSGPPGSNGRGGDCRRVDALSNRRSRTRSRRRR
eukprot:TRINITY_DN51263_c0_g1_i1.p1 TRINITY_DN51263_c0_g1~~TRINITY_DN51263_c0_g1_i1.p1  ORF type:complete len:248 (+),score=48.19 TRINITY_DN51263_c0_g1_i1:22-765(+)